MVCHPHVLPQSSTSSFSIRPINLQPTANQALHLISSTDLPYPQTEASISFLRPPICHIQPLQPRNGPPFAVGLIKPMATDNPPCPPYPQTSNRARAPYSSEPLQPRSAPNFPWVSSSPWPINYVGAQRFIALAFLFILFLHSNQS